MIENATGATYFLNGNKAPELIIIFIVSVFDIGTHSGLAFAMSLEIDSAAATILSARSPLSREYSIL